MNAGWSFARKPVADLGGRRVLVVEDEVIVAFNLECEIEDAGGVVIGPAYSLAEARALVDDAEVAVLDINVNGEQVWPVADLLRERRIPFVFASASCRELDSGGRYAGVPCFDKPVAVQQLLTTLAEIGADRQSAA